jgi:hypothetical protein
MKRISSIAVALALGGCLVGDGRGGGGEAEFRLSLPVMLPPLVVIQPGVSVVRDLDEEVFYADGYYWVRQDQRWYRSREHRGGWSRVEVRLVPAPIAQAPPGRYRRYHGDDHGRDDRDDRGKREKHGGDHN